MRKITITLELTINELQQVLQILNMESIEVPTSDDRQPGNKDIANSITKPSRPIIKPSPAKKVVMPSFGRTQQQIDEFYKKEQETLNKKTKAINEKKNLEKEKKIKEEKSLSELSVTEFTKTKQLKPFWKK